MAKVTHQPIGIIIKKDDYIDHFKAYWPPPQKSSEYYEIAHTRMQIL